MNLNQINDEDSLSEAIFSQKQQQKFKSSKSSQKSIFEYNMNDMNSALKSHDIRLEKGLKIVEKTKSSQFHN